MVNKSDFLCSHKCLVCILIFSLRLSCILHSVFCFWFSVFVVVCFWLLSDLEAYQNRSFFSMIFLKTLVESTMPSG